MKLVNATHLANNFLRYSHTNSNSYLVLIIVFNNELGRGLSGGC